MCVKRENGKERPLEREGERAAGATGEGGVEGRGEAKGRRRE